MAGKLIASVPHVRGPRRLAGVSGLGGERLRASGGGDADASGSGVGAARGDRVLRRERVERVSEAWESEVEEEEERGVEEEARKGAEEELEALEGPEGG